MKKTLLTLIILLTTSLFAGESEDFYYDRGYENGYQKGLLKGQEEAFNDAKKILFAYKNRIHAYELGKYLIQSKRLTSPQVYQEIDSQGNIKIVIIPSKIKKELNIEEIFEEFKTIPTLSSYQRNTFASKKSDFNELNSVYLSKKDQISDLLPNKVDKNSTKTTLKINKSSSNQDILNSANVAYVENKNNYEIIFFTRQEKRDFCNQFSKFCN
jgi:hypothetical protein